MYITFLSRKGKSHVQIHKKNDDSTMNVLNNLISVTFKLLKSWKIIYVRYLISSNLKDIEAYFEQSVEVLIL